MSSKLILLNAGLLLTVAVSRAAADVGYLNEGSVVAWGQNGYGQTNVPAGNDFVQIAAGNVHSLALR